MDGTTIGICISYGQYAAIASYAVAFPKSEEKYRKEKDYEYKD